MIKIFESKKVRIVLYIMLILLIITLVMKPAYAAGNVSGVI